MDWTWDETDNISEAHRACHRSAQEWQGKILATWPGLNRRVFTRPSERMANNEPSPDYFEAGFELEIEGRRFGAVQLISVAMWERAANRDHYVQVIAREITHGIVTKFLSEPTHD